MKIFFSYGHDQYTEFIVKIKEDLKTKYNITIWMDTERLRVKDDWENKLENAIEESDEIVYFITPHSARRPDGYCLNELAFALANKKPITPIMLEYVTPPLSICRIQYIDLQSLVHHFDEDQYDKFLKKLVSILESKTSLETEGEHFTLLHQLDPIDFSNDIKKHLIDFTGRQWLYDKVDELLKSEDVNLLWITAAAGFGKTAFSTFLQYNHPSAVGIHYCQYDNIRRKNPLGVLKTLIYQLSTQISDYHDLLNTLNLSNIDSQSEDVILDELLIQPLNKIKSNQSYFFIIDALDEAQLDEKNKLADLIKKFTDFPDWLKIVVTSRPEPYLKRKLSTLKMININAMSQENTLDLKTYISKSKHHENCKFLDKEHIVSSLIEKCDGNILYLKEIINSIKNGDITEGNLKEVPKGIDGLYINMFERYFVDLTTYKMLQRPLFELMVAAKEEISLELLSDILKWDDYDLEEALHPIGSLVEINNNKITFFHKSIVDWISDREKCGRDFFVSRKKGNEKISNFVDTKFYKKIKNYDTKDLFIVLKALYISASEHVSIDELDEVITTYTKSLKIKQILFHIDADSLNSLSLIHLAKYYKLSERYEYIISLERKAVYISKYLYDKDAHTWSKAYIDSLINLSIALKSMGKLTESIELKEEILNIAQIRYEENPKKWNYIYVKSLNKLASSYSEIGQMQDAIVLGEKALTIIKELYKSVPNDWSSIYATSLNNLAISYGNIGETKKAIQLEEEAFKLTKHLYAENPTIWNKSYIRSLNNLAISYKDTGKTQEAIELEEQSLEITKSLYQDNPNIWIDSYTLNLNNLANTYKHIGRFDESIALEKKALQITEIQYKKNKNSWNHIYIKSLMNLAVSHKNNWNVSEAIDLEKKALEVSQNLYAQNTKRWVDVFTRSLNSLAISYSKLAEIEKAIELEEKSLIIREELYSKTPKRWVDAYTLSLNNLAVSYKSIGKIEEALILDEKNLNIRKQLYKQTPERWVEFYTNSLINLSYSYGLSQKFKQALTLREEAISLRKKLYEDNPQRWADVYAKSLAGSSLFYGENEIEKIINLDQESLKIREELYKQNPNRWVDTYVLSLVSLTINLLYKNSVQDALKLYQKALDVKEVVKKQKNNTWYDDYIHYLVKLDFEKIDTKMMQKAKQHIQMKELFYKQSPDRWSDAFKS